jgi:hypothetical protein
MLARKVGANMLRLLALPVLAVGLSACAGNPTQYPDLPKIPQNATFMKKTLVVQKWAKDSCFYNTTGVAQLAGFSSPYDPTFGEFADALWQWFYDNDGDVEDALPDDRSYHAAVYTGCIEGLEKWNK